MLSLAQGRIPGNEYTVGRMCYEDEGGNLQAQAREEADLLML